LLTLVERNTQLDVKVRGAAAQTTAINERYLRRISSDLHDGPGQDLGFALMRLDSIARSHECAPASADSSCNLRGELDTVRSGLESGLADLRAISAGLRLPDISKLSNYDIAARAVRDYERKAGASVILTTEGYAGETALPVKITLYRLLQESLANGFRHAGGVDQRVRLSQAEDYLSVEIADGGPGFDPVKASTSGGIGLAGMRERVRALGGLFELHATPGQGTVINATLPVRVPGGDDE
jgi:signal transduction histidine kinase